MQIQGIPCITSQEEWIRQLDRAFNSNNLAHNYLYMNPDGAILAFENRGEAINQNYRIRLTAQDIVDVTRRFFSGQQENEPPIEQLFIIKKALEVIRNGIQNKWVRYVVPLFSSLNNKLHSLKNRVDHRLNHAADARVSGLLQDFCLKFNAFKQLVQEQFPKDERFITALNIYEQNWKQQYLKKPKDSAEWDKHIDTLEEKIQEIEARYKTFQAIALALNQLKLITKKIKTTQQPHNNSNSDSFQNNSQIVDEVNTSSQSIIIINESPSIDKTDLIKVRLEGMIEHIFDPMPPEAHDDYQYQEDLVDMSTEIEALKESLNMNEEEEERFFTCLSPIPSTIVHRSPDFNSFYDSTTDDDLSIYSPYVSTPSTPKNNYIQYSKRQSPVTPYNSKNDNINIINQNNIENNFNNILGNFNINEFDIVQD